MTDTNLQKHCPQEREFAGKIQGIDLFCGVGGLTRGLEEAGINVVLGVDNDPACEYPYSANNKASFLLKSVDQLGAADFRDAWDDTPFKLLAGCAPCQPFSTYSRTWSRPSDERWNLLEHFARLVQEIRPHLVTMENVPHLEGKDVYSYFVSVLDSEGFKVFNDVVNCADYGVPQRRRRLVLLASRLGPVDFVEPTTEEGSRVTVREAIGNLTPIAAGEVCKSDAMHKASELSPLNLKRIRASKPGGTWRDWDASLRAKCHTRLSGQTYPSVYGRMTWDEPSPTVTTQYYGFGNGRFGHPDQDRAISLREGAILQGFSADYKFVPKGEPIRARQIGRLIGNAVPVNLGSAIGTSLARHVEAVSNQMKNPVPTENPMGSERSQTEFDFMEKPERKV